MMAKETEIKQWEFFKTPISHALKSTRQSTFKMLVLLGIFVTTLCFTGIFLLFFGAIQEKLTMWSGGAFGLVVAGWSIKVWYNTWKDKKFIEFLYDLASKFDSIPDSEKNAYSKYLINALLKWREIKLELPPLTPK